MDILCNFGFGSEQDIEADAQWARRYLLGQEHRCSGKARLDEVLEVRYRL